MSRIMGTMRSKATIERYEAVRKERGADGPCPLCVQEPIKEFAHWTVQVNAFPYDLVADTHHMLVSKRHIAEEELTEEEWIEFSRIKHTFVAENYDILLEGTPRQKSIPGHFHIHLVVLKEEE
jgi:diadenosine tetraphosphate (Ap4A) HIT family hydrolase